MFAQCLDLALADEPDIDVFGLVHNVLDAVAYIAKTRPQVVLIESQMSDGNGIDVTARIKRTSPKTAVVMLTESANERVMLAALEAGCSGFLTKDGPLADVADAIRSAAAGDAILSPIRLARLLPRLYRSYQAPVSELTEREREVLTLLAAGWSTPRIAAHLFLSVNTIRNYIQSTLTKLGAHSRLEAVSIGTARNLIDPVAAAAG